MPFIDIGSEGIVHVHYYDPTHPEAREFVWERVREGYYAHGIKGWWLDACEPEMHPLDPDSLRYYAGDGTALTNIYPMMNAHTFYDGMRAEGEEEIISLCRSAWSASRLTKRIAWSMAVVREKPSGSSKKLP